MIAKNKQMLITIGSVLVALAVNLAIDATTDFPTPLRWTIAIVAALLLTTVVELLARAPRGGSRDSGTAGTITRDTRD